MSGVYLPTKKNAQVKSFYKDVGFISVSEGHYELNSINNFKTPPQWIISELEVEEPEA